MSKIKTHIKLAVDIPTTDPDNKLLIEPGTKGVVILSDGSGLKVGVDKETLIDAVRELDLMKIRHSYPDEKVGQELDIAVGEIIEGDDEEIPF